MLRGEGEWGIHRNPQPNMQKAANFTWDFTFCICEHKKIVGQCRELMKKKE